MVIGQILGVEKVVTALGDKKGRVRVALQVKVRELAIMLAGYVKMMKLTGEVLHVRSGRLRRSITYQVQTDGTIVSGLVGTIVEYARAHEFGVNKVMAVTVRDYLRRTKTSMREARKIGWRGKYRMAIAREATMGATLVHSFTRQQHIKLPERSFLRTSLNELGPGIREDLAVTVRGAIA